MDIFAPLSRKEQDELAEFLISDERSDSCLNLVELDGLLTCVVSGPDSIMPSEWLPVVWGDDKGGGFKTIKQAQRIFDLLIRHLNGIAGTLMNSPEKFEPLLYQGIDDCEKNAGADEWCIGYLAAMALRTEMWDRFVESKQGIILTPVFTLGLEEGYKTIENAKDPAKEYRKWVDLLAPSVRAIHAYWLMRRSGEMGAPGFKPSFDRKPKKAGRAGSSSKDRDKKSRRDVN